MIFPFAWLLQLEGRRQQNGQEHEGSCCHVDAVQNVGILPATAADIRWRNLLRAAGQGPAGVQNGFCVSQRR